MPIKKPYAEWPEESKRKHRIQTRLWKKRNREKTKAQKRRWWARIKEKDKKKRVVARAQERAEILKLFGTICILCGKNPVKRVQIHEIYGKRHPRRLKYYLEHKEDFVCLCYQCHRMVHRMMKVFGVSWKDILSFKSGNVGRD